MALPKIGLFLLRFLFCNLHIAVNYQLWENVARNNSFNVPVEKADYKAMYNIELFMAVEIIINS